jgi:hypothetical protein
LSFPIFIVPVWTEPVYACFSGAEKMPIRNGERKNAPANDRKTPTLQGLRPAAFEAPVAIVL